MHLTQPPQSIRKIAEAEGDGRGIKNSIGEWQRLRRGHLQLYPASHVGPLNFGSTQSHHGSAEVQPMDVSPWKLAGGL